MAFQRVTSWSASYRRQGGGTIVFNTGPGKHIADGLSPAELTAFIVILKDQNNVSFDEATGTLDIGEQPMRA